MLIVEDEHDNTIIYSQKEQLPYHCIQMSPDPNDFIIQRLRYWASNQPSHVEFLDNSKLQIALTFCNEKGVEKANITYHVGEVTNS